MESRVREGVNETEGVDMFLNTLLCHDFIFFM